MAYGGAAEQLVRHFHAWERRGRGWDVWPYPVGLEPPFRLFPGHYAWQEPYEDTARRPGLLSRLFGKAEPPALPEAADIDPEEPEPEEASLPAQLSELRILLPEKFELPRDAAEQLLLALRFCTEPLAFELVAAEGAISLILTARGEDAPHALDALQAFAPPASIIREDGFLSRAWFAAGGDALIIDLGLSEEFMRPVRGLRGLAVDPLAALVGALSSLQQGEAAVFQALFHPARHPWEESIGRAVLGEDGEPFFATGAACAEQAKQKAAKPLFAVRPRLAIRAESHARRMQILRALMGALSQLDLPGANSLIALDQDGWPPESQTQDLLFRVAHRPGMLLNVEELAALVHLPNAQVASPKFSRHTRRTKAAPASVRGTGARLGENVHLGQATKVFLPQSLRMRHTYAIGGSGTGKSTLLLNLALQDLEEGRGVAVLDPHGDLVDGLVSRMPESRVRDVILLNPADEEFPIGLNILSANSELEKGLLSSDLVATFRRLSSAWGDQMNAVLGNAILAFLESSQGGTLLDMRHFLVDKAFRSRFLATVQDAEVVYFWEKEFPLLIGRAASPLLTRLDVFLRPKPIRNMVAQRRCLDFRAIIDGRKVLLAKLPQGAIGEENAHLLGSLLTSKLHQAALSRQDVGEGAREGFNLIIDEFQDFATPSMAALLSGVRKYGLGLTLAHQNLAQLGGASDALLGSVLANASTRICFRLGDIDAKRLAEGFSSFEARDLQSLGVGQAIVRAGRAEDDFNVRTYPAPDVDPADAARRTDAVVAASRAQYATPKAELAGQAPLLPAAPAVEEAPAQAMAPDAAGALPAAAAQAPAVAVPSKAAVDGRGGQQHRYLQTLIKRLGEEHGFRASLEVPVLNGTGNVDVVLEREGLSVACEITVTTTTGHEVGNLQKCLAAGYARVVLVSPTTRNLNRVKKRAAEVFSTDELARMHFTLPEGMPELLGQFAMPLPRTDTVKGYKVKVQFHAPDEALRDAKAEAIRGVIGRALKQKREG